MTRLKIAKRAKSGYQNATNVVRRNQDCSGDIDDQKQMVMSDVLETHYYISGGFTTKTFKSQNFCVSLINPPEEPGDNARVGVMTITVKNGEGNFGFNNCLWYDPTPQYKKAVDEAVTEAKKLTKN